MVKPMVVLEVRVPLTQAVAVVAVVTQAALLILAVTVVLELLLLDTQWFKGI
jgi:hypothetical protein